MAKPEVELTFNTRAARRTSAGVGPVNRDLGLVETVNALGGCGHGCAEAVRPGDA